ncbi:hypothetical protein BHM03_00044704 [Ensete ventricosum]|nr:hypothetical protein BHM03_00044704 [Ensete ventricosum]
MCLGILLLRGSLRVLHEGPVRVGSTTLCQRGLVVLALGQPRCAKCRRGLVVPRYLGRFEVAEVTRLWG